jgi:HlyD family secretion protein
VAELSSSLAAARREAERAGQLWSKGAGGKPDWERARDQVSELEARLAAKQAQERAQRIDLDANRGRTQAVVRSLATRVADADVRAPLDGVVLARYVEPGEVVAVNQPIYKIGDIRSLLLEVTIDESDVARVHDGATPSKVAATLNAFPGRVFAGHVTQLMPDADREKKTYLAKVALDEPVAGLRSGMTVEVNIIVEEHTGVLLAPADAIVDNEAWVVRDGRVERRRVELGIHDLVRAEVKSGLAEGDQLVIGGGERLSRGKRVRTSERAPDPLAAPGAQGGTARSAG